MTEKLGDGTRFAGIGTKRIAVEAFDWNAAKPGEKAGFELMLDAGLQEPLAMPAMQISGAHAGPALLVLAAVHGDEYEGIETALRLFRTLDPQQVRGTVVMVAAANPLAYAAEARCSPEDGANLARVFPGRLDGSPTERIAYWLTRQLIAKSDFLLDLHSGGSHYSVATLAGYYFNEESEIGRRSREAAEAFGAELLWAHESIAPGRSVSAALAYGVPWLYTEAYGGRRIRREDAELFYGGTLRLMRHLGMLDGQEMPGERLDAPGKLRRRRIYGDGNFDKSAEACADGFFVQAVPLGAEVGSGDRIGTICSLDGQELQQVRAASGGLLVMVAGSPKVRKGDPLYMLAAVEPVAPA